MAKLDEISSALTDDSAPVAPQPVAEEKFSDSMLGSALSAAEAFGNTVGLDIPETAYGLSAQKQNNLFNQYHDQLKPWATPIIGDYILDKLKNAITPQTVAALKQFKEDTPTAQTVGSIAGLFAPIEGPLAALGKGGKLVQKAITNEAAPIITKGIGMAARGAIESEIFNVFNNASSQALEANPDMSAESLLAHSGSALGWGAGLGLGMPIAGMALGKVAGKSKDAVGRLIENWKALRQTGEEVEPTLARKAAEKAGEGYAKVAGMTSPVPEDKINEMLDKPFTEEGMANRKAALNDYTDEERAEFQRQFQKDFFDAIDTTDEHGRILNKEIKPHLIKTTLADAPFKAPVADIIDKLDQMQKISEAMHKEPFIYSNSGLIRKFDLGLEHLNNKLNKLAKNPNTAELFETVDDFKTDIDKQLQPYKNQFKVDPKDMDTINKIRDARTLLREHLLDAKNYPAMATGQQEINEAWTDWLAAKKEAEGFFKLRGEWSPQRMNTFVNQVSHARADDKVEAMENMLASMQNFSAVAQKYGDGVANINPKIHELPKLPDIDELTKRFGQNALMRATDYRLPQLKSAMNAAGSVGLPVGAAALGHPAIAAGLAAYRLARNPADAARILYTAEKAMLGSQKVAKKAIEDFLVPNVAKIGGISPGKAYEGFQLLDKDHDHPDHGQKMKSLMDNLADNMASPLETTDKMDKSFNKLNGVLPKTKDALIRKQITAMNFLHSKVPSNPFAADAVNPNKAFTAYNSSQISKFYKYVNAVNNPNVVLQHMANHTISPEEQEVMQNVYPELYGAYQAATLSKSSDLEKGLSYNQKRSLGTFMNVKTPSFSPEHIKMLQNNFIKPAQTPKTSNRQTHFANNASTPSQSKLFKK